MLTFFSSRSIGGALLVVFAMGAELFLHPLRAEHPFTGSATFYAAPRFFSDSTFGSENRFGTWGFPEFGATFGLFKFKKYFEPIIGVSYVEKSSKSLPSTQTTEISINKFTMEFVTTTLGIRYKAWERQKSNFIPFAEAGINSRFGRIKKQTNAVDQKTSVLGGDFGADLTAGCLISFFSDQKLKDDMSSEWEVKDFDFQLQASYLPAGFFRYGLAGVQTTGGYSFGGGVSIDW